MRENDDTQFVTILPRFLVSLRVPCASTSVIPVAGIKYMDKNMNMDYNSVGVIRGQMPVLRMIVDMARYLSLSLILIINIYS